MPSPPVSNKANFLPPEHYWGHHLCLTLHDVLVRIITDGEESNIFNVAVAFRDAEDRAAFEEAADVYEWLEQTRRVEEREELLMTTVFPAVLSDMLHYIYEALQSCSKAKLAITYTLLRKPLQEGLYLLESLVADRKGFAETLAVNPLRLRAQKAGGVTVHADRIRTVLRNINKEAEFDADYLAQIRYDKTSHDSFDPICNKATHLFTEHHAIQTERLNINFIFSQHAERVSQWAYLYSRLPYVLAYTHAVAEHTASHIAETKPAYLDDINRRIASQTSLWWDSVSPAYVAEPLHKFVGHKEEWLRSHCSQLGYRSPSYHDLRFMAKYGGFPGGEGSYSSSSRRLIYRIQVFMKGLLSRDPEG